MSMSNEVPIDAAEFLRLWRPYWLPPGGWGNGLDALYWVEVARIAEHLAEDALRELAAVSIPAWVVPEESPFRRRRRGSGEPHLLLFVATISFDDAEAVIMRLLNEDAHRLPHTLGA